MRPHLTTRNRHSAGKRLDPKAYLIRGIACAVDEGDKNDFKLRRVTGLLLAAKAAAQLGAGYIEAVWIHSQSKSP